MIDKTAMGAWLGALLLLAPQAEAGGKPKIKPSVTYASTWDGALDEAKLLNLPIVLHSHGFY